MTTSSEKNLIDLLSKYQFKYKDLTKRDILGALSYFKDLNVKTDNYSSQNGISKEMVCLVGTIPVNFRNSTYNIPIQIYLSESHPYEPPISYVRPTIDMSINVSETVDTNGRIYLPALSEWNFQNSDLYMLLNLMTIRFSEQTPLYSKVNRLTKTPHTTEPKLNSTLSNQYNYNQLNNVPYPVDSNLIASSFQNNYQIGNNPHYKNISDSNLKPYSLVAPYPNVNSPYFPLPTSGPIIHLKSDSNSNIGQTRTNLTKSFQDDTIKPEHYRMSLVSAIQDKIRLKFKEIYDEKIAEVDSLKKLSIDLEKSQQYLNMLINEAEYECNNIKNLTNDLKEKKKQLNENISKITYRNKASIQDSIVSPTPLYRQMIQLFSEEMTLQDLIFYFSEGLSHKTVCLESFLKQVRFFSRKQFFIRAAILKAREQAFLPSF